MQSKKVFVLAALVLALATATMVKALEQKCKDIDFGHVFETDNAYEAHDAKSKECVKCCKENQADFGWAGDDDLCTCIQYDPIDEDEDEDDEDEDEDQYEH